MLITLCFQCVYVSATLHSSSYGSGYTIFYIYMHGPTLYYIYIMNTCLFTLWEPVFWAPYGETLFYKNL